MKSNYERKVNVNFENIDDKKSIKETFNQVYG
jgi:hypothetical protein